MAGFLAEQNTVPVQAYDSLKNIGTIRAPSLMLE